MFLIILVALIPFGTALAVRGWYDHVPARREENRRRERRGEETEEIQPVWISWLIWAGGVVSALALDIGILEMAVDSALVWIGIASVLGFAGPEAWQGLRAEIGRRIGLLLALAAGFVLVSQPALLEGPLLLIIMAVAFGLITGLIRLGGKKKKR